MNTHNRSRTILLGACLALLFALGGCATNPVTKRTELKLVSEQQEISIGAQQYAPSQQSAGGKFILDPALTAYVNEVGQKLARVSDRPSLPFEFVVINDSVPNAWALPGGKLAVNRGLLTELKSEAELAAVLSHEIVHAAARHGAGAMERGILLSAGAAIISVLAADNRHSDLIDFAAAGGATLLTLRFSREHELEADHYGMDYMVRAGYDPKAAVELQETFVRLSGDKSSGWLAGMFATHPPSQERVDANRRMASALPANLFRGEDVYRRKLAFLIKSKPAYAAHDEGRKVLEKDPAQALAKADQAIKLEPREAMFHALRGDALKKLGRVAEAEHEYGEAIKRNDDYYAYYLNRGLTRSRLGNKAGAQSDLERSNALLPTAAAHYVLGNLAQGANNPAKAIEHFRLAAGSDSEVGKRAGASLVRLDLPRNPGSYVQVEPVADASGNLGLRVTNRSPIALRNLRVAGAVPGSNFVREYSLPGTLKPGQATVVAMGVKLSDVKVGLNQVRGQVRSADFAE
ncbi:MAG: putative Zn-dependent protease [Rhodocyclaceae bacterium]|nr:MAG: putative Zn-dependent protease [Rhodocyclaceae bacterium]TNC99884.1 MAG: putative Zn-dependent protease [Rhodocyclaceae bacterium]